MEYGKDYNLLKRKGMISNHLLHYLWRDVGGEKQEKFLLDLMKNMSLISEWKVIEEGGQNNVTKYLVPSLLNSTSSLLPKEEDAFQVNIPELTFDLDFNEFFLPHGLFPRLVALIVSHSTKMFDYSCSPILTNKRALLSFGYAVFSLELIDQVIRVGIMESKNALLIRQLLSSMIEKLQDEVMGKSLKWIILLNIPTSKGIIPVSFKKKAKDKNRKKVFGVNKVLVELEKTRIFFEKITNDNEEEEGRVPNLIKNRYHTFLSYYQATAMDQVSTLYQLLTNEKHFNVWYDQKLESQITETAMVDGVSYSVCLIVFLSKSVFTREFCLLEIRKALELNKPIIFIHEEDSRSPGKIDFYELKMQAPDDILPLLNNIESIPYRRRKFEADAMLHELGKRITTNCTKNSADL